MTSRYTSIHAVRPSWTRLAFIACIGVVTTSLGAQDASGTAAPEPIDTLTAPVARDVTVETRYVFDLAAYTPVAEARPSTRRADHDHETPEAALLAFYGAMVAGDWAWFESCWTSESRRFNAEQNRRFGRDAESFSRTWKQVYRNARLRVRHRLEMAPFVMLHYEVVREGLPPQELTTVFEREGERWLASQRLATHMVPNFWQRGGKVEREGTLPWPLGDRLVGTDEDERALASREPLWPLGPPERRTLDVDIRYRYDVALFTPPPRLGALPRERSSYEHPMRALESYVAARRAKDAAWELESCERQTRKLLGEMDLVSTPQRGAGAFGYEAGVARLVVAPDDAVTVTHRVVAEGYCIYALELAPSDGGAPRRATVVTAREGTTWRVTHAIDSDPLLEVWRTTKSRVPLSDSDASTKGRK